MKFITEILLKSQIQKDATNRKKQFLSWDAIQKVAIIIDNSTPINKSVIDKLAKTLGIQVLKIWVNRPI